MNAEAVNPVEIENLTVCYGKVKALEGVSLSIPEGSITALMGRNGAGKSSLIRCLLGLQRAASGKSRVFGSDSWLYRCQNMEKTGYVPEDPDAPPEMTPAEISRFLSRLYPSWDSHSVLERFRDYDVPERNRFSSLSKGQKGLTMLALALGHDPSLLILDDPTLGLDVVARKVFFREVLGHVAERGVTVLITTHDLQGIDGVADRIAILKRGKLLLSEPLESLKARFRKLTFGVEVPDDPALAGKELDAFDAVDVKVRGWGVEAIVSDFCEEKFARMAELEHVHDLESHGLGLEEVFFFLNGGEKGEKS